MADNLIVDASVAAKLYFREDLSDSAERIVRTTGHLIAPELILAEVASVAIKRLRRGETDLEEGRRAVASLVDWIDELIPQSDLHVPAFEIGATHGFSAYDATYLALARQRGVRLITADLRLHDRACRSGLGDLVTFLT